MKLKDLGAVLGLLAIVGLIIFSAWAHFAGPCSLYKYSAVGKVPSRCLTILK
jgi:hypothetical protein